MVCLPDDECVIPVVSVAPMPQGFLLAQQGSLEIPTSAVIGIVTACIGALVIGTTRFFISQAMSRWIDKIELITKSVAKLEQQMDQAPSHKELQHFEQRLSNLGGALQTNQDHYRDVQSEILEIRKQLSSNYLQREDWVKNVTVTEAKLDALHRRLDEMSLMLVRALSEEGKG